MPISISVVDWERGAILAPLYSLASLYKYAKACPASPVRSCLNKIGAAHHWPSSVWIWWRTINPLMSYIRPQITPPSRLDFAILNGGSFWRLNLAGLGSPRGKPAENTRHLTWRVGGGRLDEVWFGSFSSTAIVFWWFLQTYMTSGPCSSWFFIVVERCIFW
jgi:hypothetical protein